MYIQLQPILKHFLRTKWAKAWKSDDATGICVINNIARRTGAVEASVGATSEYAQTTYLMHIPRYFMVDMTQKLYVGTIFYDFAIN